MIKSIIFSIAFCACAFGQTITLGPANFSSPVAIGDVTPNTGAFTTVSTSNNSSASIQVGSGTNAATGISFAGTRAGVGYDGSSAYLWGGTAKGVNIVVNASQTAAAFDSSLNTTLFGGLSLPKTITASGTTGAQTINKSTGSVNFAAAAGSLVVTNSLVTANSIILCTVGTNDTSMHAATAVAAAGSFTIRPDVPPAAETRVNFLITN